MNCTAQGHLINTTEQNLAQKIFGWFKTVLLW